MENEPRQLPIELRLQQWKEQGFTDNTVASYGLSVNNLTKTLAAGYITPTGIVHLPYQEELMRQGNLYYVTPFLGDAFERSQPELNRRLHTELEEQSYQPLTDKQLVRQRSADYALTQAMEDGFMELSGKAIEEEEIHALSAEYTPTHYTTFFRDVYGTTPSQYTLNETMALVDQPVRTEIKNQLTEKRLRNILTSVLQRRGVILYFNKGIFHDTQVDLGRETKDELTIVSKYPLSLDTIEGIEFLSPADEEAIRL